MNLVFLIDLTYLDELKMYLQGESHYSVSEYNNIIH